MNSLTRLISAGIILAILASCTSTTSPEVHAPTTTPRVPDRAPAPAKPTISKIETATITEIDVSRFFALREEGKTLIYDVRLPLRYHLGHIKGAVLFYPKPFDEAFAREKPQMVKAIGEGKTIILYCGGAGCHDSQIVGKMIAERGIPVSVYSGGWAEWKEIGIE